MFKKMWANMKKSMLAARIADRGICPKHGQKLGRTWHDTYNGVISTPGPCATCQEEAEVARLEAKQRYEQETERMLAEYHKL
jgi:hypothetical protein